IGSTVLFLPKHRLYANLPFDFCSFNGSDFNKGTIAPSIVLDQGPFTTLAAAAPDPDNFIRIYKFTGTSRVCPDYEGKSDITTLGVNPLVVNVPPPAEQPGSGACPAPNCIDTLDGRFQNAGTQFGDTHNLPVRLYQVRTDSDSGFPTPL